MNKTIASAALAGFVWTLGLAGQRVSAQSAEPALDYEFFKARVQPIFMAKRPGHARCIACHEVEAGSNFHPALVERANEHAMWSEEESRKNFAEFSRVVVPGSARSKLLVHPLAASAGGDAAHGGGKHFTSQDDPEWQVLKAWVMGARLTPPTGKARILQTNSAGDNIHIIDPATNQIVGEISGIEVNHGVAMSPDGARLYVSAEVEKALDVVDGKTLAVIKSVPLSGHPNNISISRDGRKVYVSIRTKPGAVDVVDTTTFTVKTVATNMPIHNTYVTPDGKYVLGGSMEGKAVQVIDTKTDQIARTIPMSHGVRPMAMTTNPDGSTRWLFLQLSELNGFAVVDFATGKEINRIQYPAITPGKTPIPARGEIAHGIAVTPDGKTLVASSVPNSAVYSYSLPDLKLIGTADCEGKGAAWMTLTPDGARAYVSNSKTDDVSVIDITSMKEIARIAVGFSPKRNGLWMVP